MYDDDVMDDDVDDHDDLDNNAGARKDPQGYPAADVATNRSLAPGAAQRTPGRLCGVVFTCKR
jgi:hypothetical protein